MITLNSYFFIIMIMKMRLYLLWICYTVILSVWTVTAIHNNIISIDFLKNKSFREPSLKFFVFCSPKEQPFEQVTDT